MFEIEFTPEALEDLKVFKRTEQAQIVAAIETQLRYQPTDETRKRKRLRANDVANWELRFGRFRIFYNVDREEMIVSIEAVGFKVGNLLFIRRNAREL
ncbi:MAG: type II toxin-antitoxin system RelE/ParE family toxin [Acidobacteria bacterium]|nr:type II toxin-antitoxin system RelE/ParE family toxin [Acidobacteriota bacterium]MCI0623078.1 type II toxin-antitoxin system RelE/ParE family toxin [Acidobacteriota bacterium]MCI0721844.1 type II toxin-antitoxin system RelE/ParE family toxin [Acidobacteriota bacterium]